VEEKIVCTFMQDQEVNLSILHHKEEKEMKKLFYINIQIKNTKVDALFDYVSLANLIVEDQINNLGM
jgi:hypothetical protein